MALTRAQSVLAASGQVHAALALLLAVGLALVGGIQSRFLWYPLAMLAALLIWPALALPALALSRGRGLVLALASMCTMLVVASMVPLGTVSAQVHALRHMEPAVAVVEEVLPTKGSRTELLLPDGTRSTVFGIERREVGDEVAVRVDPAGRHWAMVEPTLPGILGHGALAALGLVPAALMLLGQRDAVRRGADGSDPGRAAPPPSA